MIGRDVFAGEVCGGSVAQTSFLSADWLIICVAATPLGGQLEAKSTPTEMA
jgi:hypothetical protein